jgi:MFS family permease
MPSVFHIVERSTTASRNVSRPTIAVVDTTAPAQRTDGPLFQGLVWSTWALFVGLAMMLAGAGLFVTLIGVRAEREGFPTVSIGLIGAGYYFGFLVGSRLTLRALHTVGHIRVYAALASVLAATIILVGLVVHPVPWILLRLVSGACLAGQYVVAESWLNELCTAQNRARILSVYSLITTVSYGVGEFGLAIFDPDVVTGFCVAAILIALAVTPVALSEEAVAPMAEHPAHISLRELFRIVPTGVIGSALVGLAHGSLIALIAVYASRIGLERHEIAIFVLMPTVGTLLFQLPISAAADDIDRRAVGALAALTACGAAVVMILLEPTSWASFGAMAVLGGTTYPLYAIAGAYTNDWVPADTLAAVASQLIVLYGAGALTGPFLTSMLMSALGTDGYLWSIAAIHAVLALFLVLRMLQWRAPLRAKPWNEVALAGRVFYLPATAVGMGRRLRANRLARVQLPGMPPLEHDDPR